MTDFMELVKARRSVRSYQDRAVEREKLEELAQALRLAPSASNQQPWRLVIVDEPGLKDQVARATFGGAINFNKFTVGAPAIAVLVVERPRLLNQIGASLQGREFPLIDIGIGAAHICLRAAELGLGTCMLGWFDEGKIRKILGISAGRKVGLVITIGYPANGGSAGQKARKTMDEIRSYNTY